MTDNGNGNGWSQRYSVIIQTVTVVGLAVGGLWAAILGPMKEQLTEFDLHKLSDREHEIFVKDVDNRFREIRDQAMKVVPHSVDEEHFVALDKRIEEIRQSVLKLEADQVPRNEHEEHWKEEAARVTALHDNFQELNKQFQAVYNAGDVIKALQKELDDLRTQTHRDAVPAKP